MSGNENNGTLQNMDASADWVDSKSGLGRALDFDGGDDYVCKENPSTISMPSAAPFAISAWVYPDTIDASVSSNRVIAYGERDGTDSGFAFGLKGENSDELRLTTFNVKDYDTTSLTVVTEEWQFIAVSLDSSFDATFYHYRPSTDILTTQIITHSVDMNTPDSTSDLFIGVVTDNDVGSTCGATKRSPFDGQIDEARIYNRALSADEVRRLYGYEKPRINKTNTTTLNEGLVGHWTFDGPNLTTTTAADSSGQGNHGTLTNGPVPALGKIGQALELMMTIPMLME